MVKCLLLAAVVAALATLAAALPAVAQQNPTSPQGDQLSTDASGQEGASGPESPSGEDQGSVPPDGGQTGDANGAPAGGEGTGEEPTGEGGALDGGVSAADFGKRTIKEGARGRKVRRIQRALTRLSFKTRVDGVFGPKTRQNVRRFELWRNMRTDGDVGLRQWRRMKRLVDKGAQYRNHRFPVKGRHDYGGEGSRFGAPRSGHRHMGQDIAAASGTPLIAAHEGRVASRAYQAGGAGHYLVIHGRDGSDSVYMHMRDVPSVRPGQKVMAGQRIGRVGSTGSSTGAHLHFELWTPHWYAGGHAYDPLPSLRQWDGR